MPPEIAEAMVGRRFLLRLNKKSCQHSVSYALFINCVTQVKHVTLILSLILFNLKRTNGIIL